LGALERLLTDHNSKNKKNNNNNFFSKHFFGFDDLKWMNSKYIFFFKSKKITNEQQLYDVYLIKGVCGACLNFIFNQFLKITLSKMLIDF
jgi:hypothetical protein